MRLLNETTSWKEIPISRLLSFQNGINASSDKYGKGIKYISVTDILNNNYITYECIKGLVDIDHKTLNNYSVTYGDILFQRSSDVQEDIGQSNVYLDKDNAATFGGFVIRGKKIGDYNPIFFNYMLKSPGSRRKIIRLGAGAQHYNIGQESLRTLCFFFPNEHEQEKIGELFRILDEKIKTQNKIIEDFELLKKEISNQFFSVLHKFPTGIVEEYIYYEQPQKYIVNSTEYVKKNKHTIPVLTANQAFILGYTNEITGIYDKGECIIIDDFTLDCKYVDFDFKIKSSAIKILKGNDTILTKFFYEYLKFLNLSTEEHKRHYISEVSKLPINVPPLSQQNLIVNKLDLLSQKIENEKAILNLYKEQKNYLLNNMFI